METYQSWQYASRFIDTSVDDISKSILKMEADLGNGSEETAKIFNQLGVATRNADGSVRDATATFWDTIDALGRVTDETQRGIYAQKLLGSHYNSLNPLIEAGSKAYKDLAEEGMKYAVVSEENVQQLGSFNDKYEEFNATLNKTKMDTLAELSPTFEKVADAMTKALQALDDFVQSEEGQAALQGLSEALSG
ncbi:phage tail tape measure protein, partial [Ralstonia pseudosolanacearum]|uniref:phage tail tape measure protein n=1 Tax=Ralstonia pseudosolanacearum TaxID=1310165 RepID=UPI003CF9693F